MSVGSTCAKFGQTMADFQSTTVQRGSPVPGLARRRWWWWRRGVEGLKTLAFEPSPSFWLSPDLPLSLFAGPRPWPAAHRGTGASAGRCSLSLPPSHGPSLSLQCGSRGDRVENLPPSLRDFAVKSKGVSAPFWFLFVLKSLLIQLKLLAQSWTSYSKQSLIDLSFPNTSRFD